MTFDWSSLRVETVTDWPSFPRRPGPPRIVEAQCANCDVRYGWPRCRLSPYCSQRCHDQADFVRYGRKKRREHGAHLPSDIEHALRTQLALALVGGYDESARRIPEHRKQQVRDRDGYRCVECQAPGEEIDHKDGPSNELDNLQLLCKPCHRRKTHARLVPITDPRIEAERQALLGRVKVAEPERPCDDPDTWEHTWRDWWHEHAEYGQ